MPRLLLPLPIGAVIITRDEAPDGLEVALVHDLEHDEIIPHLVDGIWEARLLAELYQEDGEAVELEPDLAHVILHGIGDVHCDFRSLMRRHPEHAGVRLEALAKDGSVILRG